MLSVTIQALKKVGYVTLYTFRKILFDIQLISQTGSTLCSTDSPDWDSGYT